MRKRHSKVATLLFLFMLWFSFSPINSFASGLPFGSSGDLSSVLSIDSQTLAYSVGSPCCPLCSDKFVVNHYQPVALIEVVKGGGSSVVSTLGLGNGHSYEGNYTTHQVRIWELTDALIDTAMSFQGCKLCGVDSARRPSLPGGGSIQSSISAGCGSTGSLIKSQMSAVNNNLPICASELLYDSTSDFNWSTGCQDLALAATVPPNSCEIGGGKLFSSLSKGPGNYQACVGEWGANYPRQQANSWSDPRIGSAYTAYRAIHLAREYGQFPFSTDIKRGKLQPVYPNKLTGHPPGTSKATNVVRKNSISESGVYAYVWWVPVSCCKDLSEIAGACEPIGLSCF